MNNAKYIFFCFLLAISTAVIALPYWLKPTALPPSALPGEEPTPENRAAPADSKISHKLAAFDLRRPPSALLAEVSASDAQALLDAYQSRDIRQRRGLAWGLGYLGSDEAATALIRGLTRDCASQNLTADEEDALLEHLLALGFAAEKSDTAFVFLQQAVDEEFWQRARTWTSPRGKVSEHLPVYFALQGIGLSGRPEAKIFLESCRQREASWRYRYASSVCQGLFYLAMREQYGNAVFRRDFTATDSWKMWEKWRQGQGGEWVEWADSCRRGKRDERE
ncbi:MAG: hypothetical protein N3A66_08810 [Planctomycetota bacterium]|nr:hypothetical protein [Planctomycetota bacterium]